VLGALGPRAHARRLCNLQDILAAMPPGSSALARYVTAVYGAATSKRAALLEWFASHLRDEVEIVYKKHLPRHLLNVCRWMREPTAINDVHTLLSSWFPRSALWVHRLPGRVPCNAPFERHPKVPIEAFVNGTMEHGWGDDALTNATHNWPTPDELNRTLFARAYAANHADDLFIEVMHRRTGHCFEDMAFWMARARGSGLWYTPGAHSGVVVLSRELGGALMSAVQNPTVQRTFAPRPLSSDRARQVRAATRGFAH